MRFYRRLQPFKAISFDLDDTLYNNTPVMAVTEAKMTSYFDSLLSLEKYITQLLQKFQLSKLL